MANAALAILLSATDTASPVLKKAKDSLGGWQAGAALAGAAATGAAGTMADLAREGAADAASFKAVEQAVGNAADRFDDITISLAGHKEALAAAIAQEDKDSAAMTAAMGIRDASEASLKAVTGTTKADTEERKRLSGVLGEQNAKIKAMDDANKDSAKTISEMNVLIPKQTGQLKSMSVGQDEATTGLSEYIDKMRDTAAIGDDKMKPALASLIAVTGDYSKSMDLASLAADISRGKNVDLATAAQLVGKVSEGNVGALKKFGITLDEGASSEEALLELHKRFAGQAEAYGKTTQGQMEALSARIGDFREDIGSATNKVAPFMTMLPGLSAAYSGLGGAVGVVTKAYGGNTISSIAQKVATAAGTVASSAMTAAQWLLNAAVGAATRAYILNTVGGIAHKVASIAGTVAVAAMTAAQWLLNAALSANPIGLVIIAVAALAAGVIWAYQNVGWFRDAVDTAFAAIKSVVTGAMDLAGKAVTGFTAAVKWGLNQAIDMINGFIGFWNGLEFKIPGFNINLPSVDIPGVGRVGGGDLGWGGLNIQTPNLGLLPKFGSGGIVPGALGAPVLAMVHGGETITPPGGRGGIDYDLLAAKLVAALEHVAIQIDGVTLAQVLRPYSDRLVRL